VFSGGAVAGTGAAGGAFDATGSERSVRNRGAISSPASAAAARPPKIAGRHRARWDTGRAEDADGMEDDGGVEDVSRAE
jgi:hypothetical protein